MVIGYLLFAAPIDSDHDQDRAGGEGNAHLAVGRADQFVGAASLGQQVARQEHRTAHPVEDPRQAEHVPEHVPEGNVAFLVGLEVDGLAGQGGHRVLEVGEAAAFNGDPLARPDDRAAAFDVHHGVDVPVAGAAGLEHHAELVGLANFKAHGTGHQLASDVGLLADEHGAGDADVEERHVRLADRLGPAFEHVELAGDFDVLVHRHLLFRPVQVEPVDGAHAHEGRLRFFTVGRGAPVRRSWLRQSPATSRRRTTGRSCL